MFDKIRIRKISWIEVAIGIGFIIYGFVIAKMLLL